MAKTTNNDAAAEKSTLNRIKLLNSIAKLEAQIAKDYEKSGEYNVELNKQLDKSQKNLVKINKRWYRFIQRISRFNFIHVIYDGWFKG